MPVMKSKPKAKEVVEPVEETKPVETPIETEIEGEPNYTDETKRQVKLANGDIVSTAYYLRNKAKLEL